MDDLHRGDRGRAIDRRLFLGGLGGAGLAWLGLDLLAEERGASWGGAPATTRRGILRLRLEAARLSLMARF